MMKVLIIYKKSTYELYTQSTDQTLLKYMDSKSDDVKLMYQSHLIQKVSLEETVKTVEELDWDVEVCYRANIPETKEFDLVLVVGGDGTTLDASHYIDDTPVLSINSDPERSYGFFAGVKLEDLKASLQNLQNMVLNSITRMQVEIDGKNVGPLILNDVLYAHMNPAATTRYEMLVDNKIRSYKNSGLLVCTGAGSTAWMYEENGVILPLESQNLLLHHRGVRGEQPTKVSEIEFLSHTRQGALYIDGPHIKIDIELGQRVKIRPAQPLRLYSQLDKREKNE